MFWLMAFAGLKRKRLRICLPRAFFCWYQAEEEAEQPTGEEEAGEVGPTDSFALTATVTGKSPGGYVIFYDDGPQASGQLAVVNGQARHSGLGSGFEIGIHQLTAQYGGDKQKPGFPMACAFHGDDLHRLHLRRGITGGDVHVISGTIGRSRRSTLQTFYRPETVRRRF